MLFSEEENALKHTVKGWGQVFEMLFSEEENALKHTVKGRGQVFEMFFSEEEDKALKHTFEAGENYYQVFRFLDYIY